MSFIQRKPFTYTNISPDANNLLYVAKFHGNDVEIISGTKEDLLSLGYVDRQIESDKERLEMSASNLVTNAIIRKTTAEDLYNKIKESREKKGL